MELLVQGAAKLGIQLDQAQKDQFHKYFLEIDRWNRRLSLTTVTGWEQVQTRHFLDSLAVSAVLPESVSSGADVLDVGSGAGLPGLPLKIVFRALRVTLLESTGKKTEFLTHVVRALGLDDVVVRTGRAKELAHDSDLRENFDVVLARAVAKLPRARRACPPNSVGWAGWPSPIRGPVSMKRYERHRRPSRPWAERKRRSMRSGGVMRATAQR